MKTCIRPNNKKGFFGLFVFLYQSEVFLLSEPMTLIMEYLPHGDLLGYLRNSRRVKDKYYFAAEEIDVELTPYDLMSFAKQVASGMSFLSSMKVSH